MFLLLFGGLIPIFRNRRSLVLRTSPSGNNSLLKRRHRGPSMGLLDKLFWVAVRRFWAEWKKSLIVVTPETVVRWHRAGFRYTGG